MVINIRKQCGAALILLFLTIVLTGAVFFVTSISKNKTTTAREAVTTQALAKAKQALLSYAVSYYERGTNKRGLYGFLPCPETYLSSGDGKERGNCGNRYINDIGRFPWHTLGVPVLKDESGECLWYAVTSTYKNGSSAQTEMHNNDTPGMFSIYDVDNNVIKGSSPEDRVVAVVIAPGQVLNGQNRPAATPNAPCKYSYQDANNNISEFLDNINGIDNSVLETNTDRIDSFVTVTSNEDLADFNDRLVLITQSDIFNEINKQKNGITGTSLFDGRIRNLIKGLASCLASFAELPWAAPADLNADYRKDDSYDDGSSAHYFGRFPLIIDSYYLAIGSPSTDNVFEQCGVVIFGNELNPGNDITIDFSNTDDEYYKLWVHWKDHMFYAVSKDFTAGGAASCGTCITSNSNNIAAMVLFSGAANNQLRRYEPPELVGSVNPGDSKADILNYLETGSYPDATGNGDYTLAGNDIAYCIDTSKNIVSCP
ncbi:MAG: hypothetical protein OQL09_00975 [Gammaproteobacteria bacterium]|nr:hypothetical protein [Gammaproteobacteria bacterium]